MLLGHGHRRASCVAGGAGKPGGCPPSQSPQDPNSLQATRHCSLPALSQKQFLDMCFKGCGQALVTAPPGITKGSFVGSGSG